MIIYYTREFSGGRTESHRLLEAAIGAYTGKTAGASVRAMRTGDTGKPYIDGFDFFSISHTGSAWAVLISETECGLDIQEARKCNMLSVAKRFYHPDDAAAVETACREDETKGSDLFFRLWARREALVKADGGSAADSSIPSVLSGRIKMNGRDFIINDVCIPGMPELFAAVCLQGTEPEPVRFEELGNGR